MCNESPLSAILSSVESLEQDTARLTSQDYELLRDICVRLEVLKRLLAYRLPDMAADNAAVCEAIIDQATATQAPRPKADDFSFGIHGFHVG